MTTMITEQTLTRPTPERLTSTVLDHATVKDNVERFGMRNEAAMWQSYNCLDTLVPTPLCPDPLVDGETRAPKEFSLAPWVPAFSFAVYGAVQCSAVGLDVEDQKEEVKRIFLLSEGKGVEKALRENRFVARAKADTALISAVQTEWEAPEDLTPAAPVSVVVALALLEGYAASIYAGQPTIHMPRAAATLLEGQGLITFDGNKARTKNGSKVVIGGGYDDITMLSTGKWDMYATGEVYVEKSKVINVNAYELQGEPADTVPSRTPFDSNTSVALVERAYRAAVDCFVAKATATVW
jgi:hypothetical protein